MVHVFFSKVHGLPIGTWSCHEISSRHLQVLVGVSCRAVSLEYLQVLVLMEVAHTEFVPMVVDQ